MAVTQDSTSVATPEGKPPAIDEEAGLNHDMGSMNGPDPNTAAHQADRGTNNPTSTTQQEGIHCNNLESAIRKLGMKMTREELWKELGDQTVAKKD